MPRTVSSAASRKASRDSTSDNPLGDKSSILVSSSSSRKSRLCDTTSTVPLYSFSVAVTSAMASSSRWFVGSSKIRAFTCRSEKLASSARARAPGLSCPMGRSTCCRVRPYCIRRTPAAKGSMPVSLEMNSRGVSSRGSASCSCVRLPKVRSRPTATSPPSGEMLPVMVRSSVLLPAPLNPTIATRSPKSTRSDTGGSGSGSPP
mmetsp:Transcript_14534/g.43677  ORF Transcript_14534/g.43677 Transcript_14534/m.43677 type:complete len:204 (-) Transcript_14534:1193-1804(-)